MSEVVKKSKGIALNIPSDRIFVHMEWAMAVNALSYPPGMNRMIILSMKDPKIKVHTRDQQREILAEKSLAIGPEFIVCIDDDTVPPPNAINDLFYAMCLHPNAAIVGGIYPSKSTPEFPLVWKELGAGPYWDWTVGDIFPVEGIATGCMMIRTNTLTKIPKPWFKDTSVGLVGESEMHGETEVRVTGRGGSDDLYFCKKALDAGFEVYAHGGVLPQHIEYKTDEAGDPCPIFHRLPVDSPPFLRYIERQKAK
jgi:hypothetical protein